MAKMNNPENPQEQTSNIEIRLSEESVREIGLAVGGEVAKQFASKKEGITEEQKNNLQKFFQAMRGKFTNFSDEEKFYDRIYNSIRTDDELLIVKNDIERKLTNEEKNNIDVNEALKLCVQSGLSQESVRSQIVTELRRYMTIRDDELDLFSKDGIISLLDEDGNLPDRAKIKLKRTALKLINQLFAPVDADPEKMFQESYNEYHEGVAYRYLKRIIINLDEDVRKVKGVDESVSEFIQKGILQEVSRERELRELSHNIDIWMKVITGPKELIQQVARYNLSSLTAPLTSETGGKIISVAINELERFLQFDMGINQNQVRPGLFASGQNTQKFFLESADREKLKKGLIKRIKALQEQSKKPTSTAKVDTAGVQDHDSESLSDFNDEDKWEIDRALKYANMTSCLTSMRVFEILATGTPHKEFHGSLFYDMLKFFNPSWYWRMGRGSLHKTMHAPELYEIKIDTAPQISFWRRIFTPSKWKYWNPEKEKEKADINFQQEKYESLNDMEKDWLLQSSEFKKLLNIFGMGGLASRWSYRGAGFSSTYDKILRFDTTLKDHFNKVKGYKMSDNWTKTYEILSERVGAGARFFFDAERAKEFVKEELKNHSRKSDTKKPKKFAEDKLRIHLGMTEIEWKKMSKIQKKTFIDEYQMGTENTVIICELDGEEYTYSTLLKKWNEDEWKKISRAQKEHIEDEYQKGKKYREIVCTADGKDYTYSELLEARTLVLRGSNFYALLQRSPIDFLNNINQMAPEILPKEFDGITLKIDGEDRDIIDYINLDSSSDIFKNLHADEKNKLQLHQKRLISSFGEKNIGCLQKINKFYKSVFALGAQALGVVEIDGEIQSKDKGKIIEWIYGEFADASEKVKLRNGVRMEKADINDINKQGLSDLLFSENQNSQGLIPYFQAYIGNEKSEFGNDAKDLADVKLGNAKDGFFYRMARTWYNDMGHNMHPNTADIDWHMFSQRWEKKAGENTIRRLWGDLHGWNEITKKLANLDHMLMDAAKSHKLDEIEKLHHEIHTLEGIGLDAKRANYYIATIVGRYFRENSVARIPFFIGKAYELLNAKTVSLSRLHAEGNRGAMTMDADEINAYFRRLAYSHAIGFEGPWSFQMLSRAERVDTAKIWVTDFIPNTTVLLGLFSIIKWIQNSLKEMMGGNK